MPYKDSEKRRECKRNWAKNNREQLNENHRKWCKENRKILNAEALARYHIPLGKMCQFGNCDATKNLQRAHYDYSKPLDLIGTFCARHHRIIDNLYREFD